MNEVIEVSYTGDILAHRRCGRAWAYEKYVGFSPYEQVQAMEGRLVHHAMEWLARRYREAGELPTASELHDQLEHYFGVLWARGVRTAFVSKADTLSRVQKNLFPSRKIDRVVKAVVTGAVHTEYELRSVRKVIQGDFGGKTKMLLTGVLDVVVQQQEPLTYQRSWEWTSIPQLVGRSVKSRVLARAEEVEIWDYKATRSSTSLCNDYVRQLLTYAFLYRERTGTLPVRCVLFFVNEESAATRLLAIKMDEGIAQQAVDWTVAQAKELRKSALLFEQKPTSVRGGALHLQDKPVGKRIDTELKKQCTTCGFRFDCEEYRSHLGSANHPDIRLDNVNKN